MAQRTRSRNVSKRKPVNYSKKNRKRLTKKVHRRTKRTQKRTQKRTRRKVMTGGMDPLAIGGLVAAGVVGASLLTHRYLIRRDAAMWEKQDAPSDAPSDAPPISSSDDLFRSLSLPPLSRHTIASASYEPPLFVHTQEPVGRTFILEGADNRKYGLDVNKDLTVTGIDNNSPASKARTGKGNRHRIEKGMVVIAVNGENVENVEHMKKLLQDESEQDMSTGKPRDPTVTLLPSQ